MNALPRVTLAVLLSAAPVLASQPRFAFEPNAGQADARARFLLRTRGGTFFFTPGGVVLGPTAADGGSGSSPLRMSFVGASPAARLAGGATLLGKVHYFVGNDPTRWRTGLPTYSEIEYAGLYPGVTLAYGGGGGPLKGTYTVAPGADPGLIRWRYEGGQARLDGQGRLLVDAGGGATLTEEAPIAWQDGDGGRVPVAARYVLAADGSVGFALGGYDRARPLVIDPVIAYSTFLGGSLFDIAYAVAVDPAGNAYLGGYTASANFPTVLPYQWAYGGLGDGFVAKFGPDGMPVYITYLGGSYPDRVTDIAVDAQGNAYVTGHTGSGNFPIVNAVQPVFGGSWDAFVTKLSPDGSTLVYSTFLGGSGEENATVAGQPGSIAVDASGAAYLSGSTQSPNFPTAHPFQPALLGQMDAFLTKLSPDGSAFVYSTFFGGEGVETAWDVAVDSTGHAVVAGDTTSLQFPTANAYQPQCAPAVSACWDAFVARFSPDGGSLIYSTYLGGNDYHWFDRVCGVAVDARSVAYLIGLTGSPNFPVVNAYQPVYGGHVDAFVARIGARGRLLSSTFLGGSSNDEGFGIAVDGPGAPSPGFHVSGLTLSSNFPVVDPIQAHAGVEDAFVSRFSLDAQQLLFSTWLGGGNGREEYGSTDIDVDAAGNVYVSGGTEASDFPVVNPFQPVPHGSYDAFLTRIDAAAGRPER